MVDLQFEYEKLKHDIWHFDAPLSHRIFFWVFVIIGAFAIQFDLNYVIAFCGLGAWVYMFVILCDFIEFLVLVKKFFKVRKQLKEVNKK